MTHDDLLYFNDQKIDGESQQILLYLFQNGPSTAGEILPWVEGISQNQQIHYRADEYLVPAGLVESQPKHSGHKWAPLVYSLTDAGHRSLENGNGRKLMESIRTVEDVMDATKEAVSEAESAKQSAQEFRKDLYEQDRKFDRRYDNITDELYSLKKVVNAHRPTYNDLDKKSYDAARDVQEDTIETVEELIDDFRDGLVTPGDVEPFETQVEDLELLLSDLQEEMIDGFHEMEGRIERLEERVSEVEDKQNSGWLRR